MNMSKCFLLTINYNEPDLLKMWYDYYSQHFEDKDIIVLDDGSDPKYLEGLGNVKILDIGEKIHYQNGKKVVNDGHIQRNVNVEFKRLIESNEYVYGMKVDTDEFVVPDPEKWPHGLKQFIDEFQGTFAQCSGYNVYDNGDEFDPSVRPWLSQRTQWYREWRHYCKVVLAKEWPMWGADFHSSRWQEHRGDGMGLYERPDFRLIHFHYICRHMTLRRWNARNTIDGRFQPENAFKTCAGTPGGEQFVIEDIPEKWQAAL